MHRARKHGSAGVPASLRQTVRVYVSAGWPISRDKIVRGPSFLVCRYTSPPVLSLPRKWHRGLARATAERHRQLCGPPSWPRGSPVSRRDRTSHYRAARCPKSCPARRVRLSVSVSRPSPIDFAPAAGLGQLAAKQLASGGFDGAGGDARASTPSLRRESLHAIAAT